MINMKINNQQIITINNQRVITITLIIALMIALIFIVSCSKHEIGTDKKQDEEVNKKITVAATFYPLYDLTKSIIGDNAVIYSIIPAGVEPHDYEPNPSDIKKIASSDVFVTMGIEFAEIEENLLKINPDVKIIPASTGVILLNTPKENTAEEEYESTRVKHESTGMDPHIWLSPKNAEIMAANIINGLVDADPSNAEEYLKNGDELRNNLNKLDTEFKEALSSCSKNVVLVNHNAFSYLAKEYGFSTVAISGLEPETEPTPKQLAELIENAEEHQLKYVFYEELVDSRIADTIAEEVGAKTLMLNPLEGTTDPNATYISLMRENLNNLKIALECD